MANVFLGRSLGFFAFGLAWGVAISIVATVQLIVALSLRYRYDRWGWRSMLVGAVYPLAFWTISATAALAAQITALFKGPHERRVVWDIPREPVRRRGPQARSNVATNVPSAASSESRSPSMR